MNQNTRYQFAQSKSGKIISIRNLTQENRALLGPFTCVSCNTEMIPKLGKVKVHHFSHKRTCHCVEETYLHRLAKKLFMQQYQKALRDNTPFKLILNMPYTCRDCSSQLGKECHSEYATAFDLTEDFKGIEEEKSIHGVKPDIYLASDDGKEIFIEMAVTHRCDEKKIRLGKRIIELNISSDNDLSCLLENIIDENASNIKIFNFNKKRKSVNVCKGQCSNKAGLFIVHNRGKAILIPKTYKELSTQTVSNKPLYMEIIYDSIFDQYSFRNENISVIFKDAIRRAYFDKHIEFQNCYVCRFHGIGITTSIFCKKYKVACECNDGAQCRAFWSFENRQEANRADMKNMEYIQKISQSRMISEFLGYPW